MDAKEAAWKEFAEQHEMDSPVTTTYRPATKDWEVRFVLRARDPESRTEANIPIIGLALMAEMDGRRPGSAGG